MHPGKRHPASRAQIARSKRTGIVRLRPTGEDIGAIAQQHDQPGGAGDPAYLGMAERGAVLAVRGSGSGVVCQHRRVDVDDHLMAGGRAGSVRVGVQIGLRQTDQSIWGWISGAFPRERVCVQAY